MHIYLIYLMDVIGRDDRKLHVCRLQLLSGDTHNMERTVIRQQLFSAPRPIIITVFA